MIMHTVGTAEKLCIIGNGCYEWPERFWQERDPQAPDYALVLSCIIHRLLSIVTDSTIYTSHDRDGKVVASGPCLNELRRPR